MSMEASVMHVDGTTITTHIRWMIRSDMQDVLTIEGDVFEFPWFMEDFIRVLRDRSSMGMVAWHENHAIAYMLYELLPDRIKLHNFAVSRNYWGRGVGSQMMRKLIRKLTLQRRNRIICVVRERNLDAQLFFKAMGFTAVRVLHNHYPDTDEDAYGFVRRYGVD